MTLHTVVRKNMLDHEVTEKISKIRQKTKLKRCPQIEDIRC